MRRRYTLIYDDEKGKRYIYDSYWQSYIPMEELEGKSFYKIGYILYGSWTFPKLIYNDMIALGWIRPGQKTYLTNPQKRRRK